MNRCVGLRHNTEHTASVLPIHSIHGPAKRQTTATPPGAGVIVPPTPLATVAVLPPPEPPPTHSLIDFPHGSLAAALILPPEPKHQSVTWPGHTNPTTVVSVAHVLGSPRVCSINSADTTSITVTPTDDTCPLFDGGSNICITGDASLLVDAVDIPPVTISVALAGGPSSFDDTITKQGLLPLTLSDGTTYYQP